MDSKMIDQIHQNQLFNSIGTMYKTIRTERLKSFVKIHICYMELGIVMFVTIAMLMSVLKGSIPALKMILDQEAKSDNP